MIDSTLARSSSINCAGIALVTLLAACTGPKMAVPASVAKTSLVLEAQDRSLGSGALTDEGFKLGSYPVTEVDRDWNSSEGFSAGPFANKKATTGYEYQLTAGKTKLKGTCGSETKENSLLAAHGTEISWGSTTVACSCKGGSSNASLTWSGDKSEVTVDGSAYAIEPIYETADGASVSEPIGFSATGQRTLGAVEVSRPGRVWLNKELSEQAKAEASCLFVGLMLYVPPSDD